MRSTGYQLVDQPPSEVPEDAIMMGKKLGTFRAVYLVALCSMGSFLFAYVSNHMLDSCFGKIMSLPIESNSNLYRTQA